MMELIAIIILLFGLIGMNVIIIRKVPVLVELPVQPSKSIKEDIKERIKNNGFFNSFSGSGQILLQKILSKIRILTLKTENRTGVWLMKLRQKSLEHRNKFSEDYWKKIKIRRKKEK